MKNILFKILGAFLGVVIYIGLNAVSFLVTAGMVWVACYALGLLGIYSIQFSWGLAFGVWLLLAVIRFFYKRITNNTSVKNNKEN